MATLASTVMFPKTLALIAVHRHTAALRSIKPLMSWQHWSCWLILTVALSTAAHTSSEMMLSNWHWPPLTEAGLAKGVATELPKVKKRRLKMRKRSPMVAEDLEEAMGLASSSSSTRSIEQELLDEKVVDLQVKQWRVYIERWRRRVIIFSQGHLRGGGF